MMRFSPIILALLAIAATMPGPCLASELSTQEAVHALAVILTEAGEATFNKFGKLPTPQILFGIGGTHAYGSCQSASGSIRIPGSFYCAKTNTILLEYQQLEELRRSFGDGAIIYALAHEYAHYIQTIMGIQNPITTQELQADCIAGVLLYSTAEKLGLNDSDIREIISTARAVGGGTHGTPEERAAAVFIGLKYGSFPTCGIKKPSNPPTALPSPTKSVPAPAQKPVAIKPRRNSIPHPGGNVTFIGSYRLYQNKEVPIYKVNSSPSSPGRSMFTKVYNDYSGKWFGYLTLIDCRSRSFSLGLAQPPYDHAADDKMLSIAKCK
jgi:hypothetical protein